MVLTEELTWLSRLVEKRAVNTAQAKATDVNNRVIGLVSEIDSQGQDTDFCVDESTA